MLDFADKPYRYFPPKRDALVCWLLGELARRRFLPKKDRVVAVEVSGADTLLALLKPSDRLLFAPNHPTHSDAQVLLEALRQAGFTANIMAAYDVFLRSRLGAWVMQRFGCFSVDREGTDPQAVKEAVATLSRGGNLAIFPEGNVYLQNDIVTPFHDGAALIGLKSAREISGRGRVLLVPISIKATHATEAREAVLSRLEKLAAAVEVQTPDRAFPKETLRAAGLAALRRNLKMRGIGFPEGKGLVETIRASADAVLSRLEAKIGLSNGGNEDPIGRVRKCRRAIHQVRLDPAHVHDHAAAATWADEAMLAFRIASYSGTYVEDKPSLDRFAETVEKLEEDLYGKTVVPWADRHVFVRFNPPIDLSARVEAFSRKARAAVEEVTRDCERSIQAGLDALNAANPHPGGKPF